jgi:hypothetical protein
MSFGGESPLRTGKPRFLGLELANCASKPRRNNSPITRRSPTKLAGTRGFRFLPFLSFSETSLIA